MEETQREINTNPTVMMDYDIETEAIPAAGSQEIKIIHAIGIKVNDEPVLKFTKYYLEGSNGSLQAAVRLLNTADLIIGFNSVNFDKPVIEQVTGMKLTAPHLDLMLVAKIMFTKDNLMAVDPKLMPENKELWGSFSLKAFALRIGKTQKDEFNDWSRLSTEMMNYMVTDVNVTADIRKFFVNLKESYPTEEVLNLEHVVAEIIMKQERFGFMFDSEAARMLNLRLNREKLKIEHKLAKVFKAKFLPDSGGTTVPKKAMRRKLYVRNKEYRHPTYCHYAPRTYTIQKNGKIKFPAKAKYKYFSVPHRIVYTFTDGEYQKISLVKFNPGSRAHIVRWLTSMYGWEPEIYTPTGNPKTDADTLDNLIYEEAAPLKRYLKIVKDLGQLANGDNSLLKLVGEDNRLHGRVDSLGTNTGRMSHSKPNITQVPKAEEFRKLMTVPEGKVLIDVDADALELVMLGHYLGEYDDYFYAATVDSGDKKANPPTDIHSVNQRATNLPTRDLAKTFIYGFLYGSGNTRIGWGLWTPEIEADLTYTQKEWDKAEATVKKRIVKIDNKSYFPIAKDKLIPFTDLLIKQTIFGTQTADNFLAKTVGLQDLVKDTKKKAKEDKLVGLFGHKLSTRSPHSALNLLLQHAGAVYMKYYLYVIDVNMTKAGLVHGRDYGYVANIHDAVNIETTPEIAKIICPILEAGFAEASEKLGLKYHVEGSPSIGKNQWEVH